MATRIPLFWVGEQRGVLVCVANVVRDERAIGNKFVTDIEVFAGDVAAECGPQELQTDTVAQAGVDDFEFTLP